ncbi:MAG: sigma-70 family RNA polymerase sigma factor [Pirellulales bacterium]|nr:sigma-70 family RNA polymerase sigma factor [Pirellulales bacterium]
MDEHREREIALGLREGKPEAWHALYDEFAAPLWQSVARQLGPHRAEVADIVQETLMAAARAARQFDLCRGSLWMWLSGIARNNVALYFRKRKRRDRLKPGEDGCAMVSQLLSWLENRQADPGAALESAELAESVRAALTELPRDYETLLVAKYIEEIAVEQLAAAENSTPAAIRSKLARARQAFRASFAKTAGCSLENEEHVP